MIQLTLKVGYTTEGHNVKKILAMLITAVMVTMSAAGCGGGGSGTSAPAAEESQKEAEKSQKEVEEAAAATANIITASEYLENVFRPIINMEFGTSGSSLKTAQTAHALLSFAASHELWNTEPSARQAAFDEAWNSLSREEKETVKHNFFEEELADLIDEAFSDYASVEGRFEDAGVGAEMKELTKNADAGKSWNTLRELMAGEEEK